MNALPRCPWCGRKVTKAFQMQYACRYCGHNWKCRREFCGCQTCLASIAKQIVQSVADHIEPPKESQP